MHAFTHRFAHIFQSTFVSTHSRSKSTALRNYSAARRLLHFIANLIFPFRAQHTGTKGDLQADRRLANWAWRSSSLHFFVLFSRLVPSCQVVSLLCLKLQIPET
ncbi:hypothetical protein H5410_061437 [Solanum commersonii]|uniref:Uncharacterized protein n=1 Tax=Solanum commersonii TaxID=4109 RepID=A0A9J5W8L9_SOLCO|nr:hypothetical protein H5410_061437 [Solanum commersonii]